MRAPRVPVEEQYCLIMECRKSGLSDHQWCLNNDINPGTFYNWVKRLRKNGCGDIPEKNQLSTYEQSHQEVVEYSCAMKSHFRKFGNQMSGSGNHLCNYASLLA